VSFGVSYGNASFTNVGAPLLAGTPFGAFVAMSGAVPLVGNADVVSLRVHLTDTAGVFGAGGSDLPQMVLAITRNGTGTTIGNYNIVQIGGLGGLNAGFILDNGATGAFRASAVDNIPLPGSIPVGDIITANSVLTTFSDPASFNSIDPTTMSDLLALTGPLPNISFVGTTVVPEPASLRMLVMGVLGVLGCFGWRWRPQVVGRKSQVAA
jgi:hypothetical protein